MNSWFFRIVGTAVVLTCTLLAWSGSHWWGTGIFWTAFVTGEDLSKAGFHGWERRMLSASWIFRRWSSSMIAASVSLFGIFAALHQYEGVPLLVPRGNLVFDFYVLLGFWAFGVVCSLLLRAVYLFRELKQESYWQPSLF